MNDFYVVGVIDASGARCHQVCNCMGECITITGYLPEDHPDCPGQFFEYCDAAQHLKVWAQENGLQYLEGGYSFGPGGDIGRDY